MIILFRRNLLISIAFFLATVSIAAGGQTTRPSLTDAATIVREKGPLLLHLPGVAGLIGVDRRMLAGLRDGGVTANMAIYDWTEHDPGIHALQAYAQSARGPDHRRPHRRARRGRSNLAHLPHRPQRRLRPRRLGAG